MSTTGTVGSVRVSSRPPDGRAWYEAQTRSRCSARRERRIAMPAMNDDIVTRATQNEAFRREVVTGEHSQVVVMTIPPGGEIGEEVHDHVDQVLVFVQGDGEAIIAGETSPVRANSLA